MVSIDLKKYDRQLRLFGLNTQMSISSAFLYLNIRKFNGLFTTEIIKNLFLVGFKKIIISEKINCEYFSILKKAGILISVEKIKYAQPITIIYDEYAKEKNNIDEIIVGGRDIKYEKIGEVVINVDICNRCFKYSFTNTVLHKMDCTVEKDENKIMLSGAFLSQQIIRKMGGEIFADEYVLPKKLNSI